MSFFLRVYDHATYAQCLDVFLSDQKLDEGCQKKNLFYVNLPRQIFRRGSLNQLLKPRKNKSQMRLVSLIIENHVLLVLQNSLGLVYFFSILSFVFLVNLIARIF